MSAILSALHSYHPVGSLQSTNGNKVVMAVTGIIMFLFVIGHLLRNCLVFAGRTRINSYAEFLHFDSALLWIVCGILIIALALHITATIQLTLGNKRVRPVGYLRNEAINSSYASGGDLKQVEDK